MQGFLAKAQTSRPVKNEKGITLIELLAVIVILGIIAAIAVPAVGSMISKSRVNADIESLNLIKDAGLRLAMSEEDSLNLPEVIQIEGTNGLVDRGYLNSAPKSQSTADLFVSIEITKVGHNFEVKVYSTAAADAADEVTESRIRNP